MMQRGMDATAKSRQTSQSTRAKKKKKIKEKMVVVGSEAFATAQTYLELLPACHSRDSGQSTQSLLPLIRWVQLRPHHPLFGLARHGLLSDPSVGASLIELFFPYQKIFAQSTRVQL